MMPRLLAFSFILAIATGGLASGFAQPTLPRPIEVQRTTVQQTRPSNDDKMLTAYPNPSATGFVQLTIRGQEGHRAELQVLNVIGSVVYHETITDLNDHATKSLDLSHFANGLYYVKLEGSGGNQMCKLVIR